ncbi:MAG: HD domain-containing phosphohydrolase [Pseudomonadota bacterium]
MLQTLKVRISDLDVGMFVSGLDRSWLGTPFATQGFFIRNQEDIDRLREYCDYVMVDQRRSKQSDIFRTRRTHQVSREKADEGTKRGRARISVEKIFSGRAIKPYLKDSSFEEEHPRASRALDMLVTDVDQIFDEVGEGQKLNVVKLRKSVEPIVESISRNPDACMWVARLKQHDQYTYKHSLGAAIWSVSVGRQLGLQRHDLRSLAMGCMLMDVGKLRISQELLQAKRELSNEEMAEVSGHVEHGLDILSESGILNQDVIDIVAHHHERYNGSGYPAGLVRGQIPAFAAIAAIVDTYDAITSRRSYAEALSPSAAIKLLYGGRDQDFQAELVEAFIQAIGIYPAGTLVELSSGEVAVVVAESRTRRLLPKVLLLLDADKQPVKGKKIIDLHRVNTNGSSKKRSIKSALEPDAYGIDLTKVSL